MSFWVLGLVIGGIAIALLQLIYAGFVLTLKPTTTRVDTIEPGPFSTSTDALFAGYPYRYPGWYWIVSGVELLWLGVLIASYFAVPLDGLLAHYRTGYTAYFVLITLYALYLSIAKHIGAFFQGTTIVVSIRDRTTVDQLGLLAGAWSILSGGLLIMDVANRSG